jgi:hypothetical protein
MRCHCNHSTRLVLLRRLPPLPRCHSATATRHCRLLPLPLPLCHCCAGASCPARPSWSAPRGPSPTAGSRPTAPGASCSSSGPGARSARCCCRGTSREGDSGTVGMLSSRAIQRCQNQLRGINIDGETTPGNKHRLEKHGKRKKKSRGAGGGTQYPLLLSGDE